MIKLFLLSLTNCSWDHLDEYLLSFVSPERKVVISKYKFSIDKKLSLYSALLTRMELSKLTDIPPRNLLFHTSYLQKPSLISTNDIYFNYSHTHKCILLGISTDSQIGVDIEAMRYAPLEIIPSFFHPVEQKRLLSFPSELHSEVFFEVWTKKEAYIKFLGTGLSSRLTSLNVYDSFLAQKFTTWKWKQYICSVYFPKSFELNYTIYTENDIYSFYNLS